MHVSALLLLTHNNVASACTQRSSLASAVRTGISVAFTCGNQLIWYKIIYGIFENPNLQET